MIKKILLLFSVMILTLIVVLSIRTYQFKSRQVSEVKAAEKPSIDHGSAAIRLSKAITFKTVSAGSDSLFKSEIAAFHKFLEASFPLVFQRLIRHEINGTLILHWRGRVKGNPVVLMAHQDVVPAAEKDGWKHDPFSATIDGNFIYGRGAMDIKSGVMGILEAAEALLAAGHSPRTDVYLVFGHDEETGGTNGAARAAEFLKASGVRAEFVLDEGGYIVDGVVPGVSKPVALIGIAEKGYVTLKLTARTEAGHSSMPPEKTAIGMLAGALKELEENPFKADLSGATRNMFEFIGPEMQMPEKLVFANLWLFRPVVLNQLERSASTNAAVRTTMAPTVFKSGVKDNVLPTTATALVNFRIIPGETVKSVIEHVKRTVPEKNITISVAGNANDPSPVCDINNRGFSTLRSTIRQLYPATVSAPYQVVAATDARYFYSISENVYRFIPLILKSEDLDRFHGVNERISVTDYRNVISFYYNLMKNLATAPPQSSSQQSNP